MNSKLIQFGSLHWAQKGFFAVITCLIFIDVAAISADKSYGRSYKTCGSTNPNHNVIDLREPDYPPVFRDLTIKELRKLRRFLENDPNIRAGDPNNALVNGSNIFTADLLLPSKTEVLDYLDHNGPQPERRARVVVFRGDKPVPVVEEYECGPLPNIRSCELLHFSSRRNPVEYNYRPFAEWEYPHFEEQILKHVDSKIGNILMESYGATFTDCEKAEDCLYYYPSPIGSGITREPERRRTWMNAMYNIPFFTLNMLDFALLADTSGSDVTKWFIEKIWYGGRVFDSLEDLIFQYNSGSINKTRTTKPANDENLFSSLRRRGKFSPPRPQRPPTLVEPDGKRYSVRDRQVTYLDWTFNFRMSSITGLILYDVRFKGKRIAYEIATSEFAVFYSGYAPFGQTINFVDSGELLGILSKTMVPGADCPESSTLIGSAFMSLFKRDPDVNQATFCLFENNNGYPLRRHLSYDFESGSFYGGMQDSSLTLRTALVLGNYDYIVDFSFHQTGAIHARVFSTGYIQGLFYSDKERPYSFHLHDILGGSVHHHLASFRLDLDVNGRTNSYHTLDINEVQVPLTAFPDKRYSQTRFTPNLKTTELDAVFDYDFNKPMYHVVHNGEEKSDLGEMSGYRIHLAGMSKNLVAEGQGNEPTMAWARHQMVTTKHKDDEISSSSFYGMYDGYDPVVNFTTYYSDNESIVNEDLVFWINMGMHHIPHTEDIPVTTTIGNAMSFFLLPYNYFPECPAMASRDSIYIEHRNLSQPSLGVVVDRHGNSRNQCLIPRPTLEEDVRDDPDRVLETNG